MLSFTGRSTLLVINKPFSFNTIINDKSSCRLLLRLYFFSVASSQQYLVPGTVLSIWYSISIVRMYHVYDLWCYSSTEYSYDRSWIPGIILLVLLVGPALYVYIAGTIMWHTEYCRFFRIPQLPSYVYPTVVSTFSRSADFDTTHLNKSNDSFLCFESFFTTALYHIEDIGPSTRNRDISNHGSFNGCFGTHNRSTR